MAQHWPLWIWRPNADLSYHSELTDSLGNFHAPDKGEVTGIPLHYSEGISPRHTSSMVCCFPLHPVPQHLSWGFPNHPAAYGLGSACILCTNSYSTNLSNHSSPTSGGWQHFAVKAHTARMAGCIVPVANTQFHLCGRKQTNMTVSAKLHSHRTLDCNNFPHVIKYSLLSY